MPNMVTIRSEKEVSVEDLAFRLVVAENATEDAVFNLIVALYTEVNRVDFTKRLRDYFVVDMKQYEDEQ